MLYEMVHDNHFTYGDHMAHSAREMGYCCATAYAGGDCGCHGDPCINPTDDEMIADGWFKDADGVWVHPDLPKPTPVCDTDYDPDIPF